MEIERRMNMLRVFSFGGGVQSTAALVLASQGVPELARRVFLFANVGQDSERPQTLDYVNSIAKPFAAKHGIELHELQRTVLRGNDKGKVITIYEQLLGDNNSVGIPIYMSSGAPGRRNCTSDFKIKVVSRWTREHGATKENPATVGLGFTMDEVHRIGASDRIPHQQPDYPLLDLHLYRQDCYNIITGTGLPIPPKSACWFCPFQSRSEWLRMRENDPELFERAVRLENRINEKREVIGRDHVWLHPGLAPLDQVVGRQYGLFDDDSSCESGYCFF